MDSRARARDAARTRLLVGAMHSRDAIRSPGVLRSALGVALCGAFLGTLVVFVPCGAGAQRAPGAGISDRASLLSRAGPQAIVREAEDGTIRMLYGARLAPWSGDPARDAIALARRFGRAFGIPEAADLRVERTHTFHGFTIVRLARYEDGRPVIGASVVVRFLADGAIDLVFADYGPSAVARGGAPWIGAERALASARATALGWQPLRAVAPIAAAIATADEVLPIWQVDLHGAAASERARLLIDARDGALIAASTLASHARGRVYANNPATDMGMPSVVELVDLTSAQALTGSRFRVLGCNAPSGAGCSLAQLAIADGSGDFLYDPGPAAYDDAFAEVHAYHHLSVAAAWHLERHGYSWSCRREAMRAIVNYTERGGSPYDNAAFSRASGGECGFLFFGQGTRGDYAYDADVIYHEHGHAVTDEIAGIAGFLTDGLGVSYESLAVNEGASDYYAGSIQGNPEIAESFAGLGIPGIGSVGSLRMIENDLRCPAALIGEGHEDGRIWSGVGWDVREQLGADIADALVFTSMASVTSDPSLAEAGALMIATAMGMESMGVLGAAERQAIVERIEARGLPECRRIVPLDDGMPHLGWSGSELLTGALASSVAPVHFSVGIPADAEALRLHIQRQTLSGQYTLHFFVDRPVRVGAARILSQRSIVTAPGRPIEVRADTELALPRCRTLYIAVQSTDLRSNGQSVFEIRGELLRTGDPAPDCPVIEPDAGVTASDGSAGSEAARPRGGCTCRAGSGTSSLAPALIAIALALRIARRRR